MANGSTERTWIGSVPETCDCCTQPITSTFIDGKTRRGHWAIMCINCFLLYGVGVGTGMGQTYMYNPLTGRHEKVLG